MTVAKIQMKNPRKGVFYWRGGRGSPYPHRLKKTLSSSFYAEIFLLYFFSLLAFIYARSLLLSEARAL